MEKINFPQAVSSSDIVNPLDPGRNHVDLFKLLDQLEEEYDKRM